MATIKVANLTCKRCGHTWVPRHEDVRVCPKCKSYYWDKPLSEDSLGRPPSRLKNKNNNDNI